MIYIGSMHQQKPKPAYFLFWQFESSSITSILLTF